MLEFHLHDKKRNSYKNINMLPIHFILLITRKVLFLPLLITFLVSIHFKSEAKTFHLPHIEQTIILDGKIDEKTWASALKIDLNYETSPGENIKPSVVTHAYLYENGETLFVAFDAKDDNPKAIRDYLLDRDNIWSSDFVGLKFDTFGESRKAFQFFSNARGIQADAIQEDFRGDDSTWDAIWHSKAKINDDGYVVEMAIPFRALRFPATGQKQTWGIEILRFLPRKKFHRIANSPVDRSIACNICQFDKLVGFEKVEQSKNLRLIPTLTFGKSKSSAFDDQSIASPWVDDSQNASLGLDLSWGITPETYLNATINPDFSQVEADSAQLEVNSTFSIFVDEKRPFFLDGADYFNTPNRLVHTRDLISPDYGLKVTGQTNQHSYGIISVRDEATSFLLPSNQDSDLLTMENLQSENQILRYSYDLGDKNNIGALITNKTADGYSNQVSAVDGKYWFNQTHSFTYQIMSSKSQFSQTMIDENDAIEASHLSDNSFTLNYDYQTRNWLGKVSHVDIGKDFRADLGFVSKVDFKKSVIGLRRIWFSVSSEHWWSKASVGGDWDITKDSNGKLLEKELEANARVEGTYRSAFNFGLGQRERDWNNMLFDEDFYFIFAGVEPLSGLRFNINYNWGKSIDFANTKLGDSRRVSPGVEWQANQHLLVLLNYSKQWFDVDSGELFNASAANLRLSYLFDERSSLRLTLQKLDINKNPMLYDSFLDDDLDNEIPKLIELATQFLYSYKVNPQTLFFAGYSDNGFQNDQMAHIEKEKRSVFMKFSYAWQI
jgi:hypothetical protein